MEFNVRDAPILCDSMVKGYLLKHAQSEVLPLFFSLRDIFVVVVVNGEWL